MSDSPRSAEPTRMDEPLFDRLPLEIEGVIWDRATITIEIDPARCRPAPFIARDCTRLDQKSCADLIESMSSATGQTTPVLARLLINDPDHEFEIFSGARRLFSARWLRYNGFPNFKLQLKVVELDSSAAFVAADVDNQNSAGISAFERGCSMKHAAANLFPSQQALAAALGERPATVSTLIRLADWPAELLEAFSSPLAILKVDAERLGPILEDPDRRELLLAHAKALALQQRVRKEEGSRPRSRSAVARELNAASRARTAAGSNHRRSLTHRVVSEADGTECLKLSILLPVTDKAALLAKIEAQIDSANEAS